ncbi:BACON domain-containing protein [Thalassotalea sp. ND16A]|uniref:BACON domain-containing protein n=1 Tax=Thalassotalea sp. ND16A TaxID=1535422 RepID=UPI00051A125C|nr:BACON domain-containing carbohydrate-binding protein [Thalassotalea sp. ND16A]KGK00098.1 hypothetical protein ND16A_0289 [Thalassotalea sp. ND16A]
MNKKIFLMLLSFSLTGMAKSSELGSLKGIKWLQQLPPRGGEHHGQVYSRLTRPVDSNGNYLSWDRLATQLKKKGVEAVAFRIDREDRFVDENDDGSTTDEMGNYHSELTLITEKLEARGIKVLLFARVWLSNKTDDYVFSLLDSYLSTLDVTERNRIGGIALTEIHLSNIADLKTRAQGIPAKFATAYPNWLKQRMFLLPGLGNGFHFSGIKESDTFHSEMNELVGEFAFVVKTMKLKASQDTTDIYKNFSKNISQDSRTIEQREKFMRNDMAIDDLVAYQASAIDTFPNMANIVHWGDSGDAMTNLHPKAVQALHNILTENGGEHNRGTFMYQGVGGDNLVDDPTAPNALERTIAKSVIWYDKVTDTHSKHDLKYGQWENVIGSYDQWNYWFSDNYMNVENAYVNLGDEETFDDNGQSYSLDIFSNIYWQVTGLPSWISADFEQGYADANINLTFAENTSDEARTATISVNDQLFTVSQTAGNYVVDISDDLPLNPTESIDIESASISIFPSLVKQQVKFGADIKLTLKGVDEGNTGKIFDRFIEIGMDMVRVPIYASRSLDDSFYERVYRVADQAEDKGLKIFASVANRDGGDGSPVLHGEDKFHTSLKCNCSDNIYDLSYEAYSGYLHSYIENMALNDARVDFVGPFNEDRALTSDYQQLWDKMEHSSFSRVGAEFWGLERSISDTPSLRDQLDVIGSHFYDDIRIEPNDYDNKWGELTSAANGKPVWFTESTRFNVSENEMINARTGIEHFIPAIRSGAERVVIYQAANRLVWYNGGKRAYRFSATKQFTSNATGNVVDSSSDDLAIKTVSFIDNDHLKINITNGDTSAKVTTINLQGDYSSLGSGEQALWTESVEGELTGISFDDVSCWTMTVPANSYLQLNVPVQATQGQPSTECVHIPLPQDSALPDFDNDGIANFFDEDDDNDDVLDANDAFPFDSTESLDTDGDGIGNNEDVDDDGDGIIDEDDAFNEPAENGGSMGCLLLLLTLTTARWRSFK